MILVWKPIRKRLLGTPEQKWEDNIKMGLEEIGCGMGAGSCEHDNETLGLIKAENLLTSIKS
jgi:hypothetical protein